MRGSVLPDPVDREWQIGVSTIEVPRFSEAQVGRKSVTGKGDSSVNPALCASTMFVIGRLFGIPKSLIKVEMSAFNIINQYL